MDRRTWKEPVDERIVADGLFLEHRALVRIARGAGLLVSAHTGTLWITQQGKRDDIVLTAGQWHRLEGDALVIASALQAGILTISAPLAAAARWKIQRVSAAGMRDEVRSRRRSDIGFGEIPGASPAERAERYRWRQDSSWPSRESTFI
jgi:hypothetical protein